MNKADLFVLTAIFLSAMLASARGVMREVAAINPLLGAAIVTACLAPEIVLRAAERAGHAQVGILLINSLMFAATLALWFGVANWIRVHVEVEGRVPGHIDRGFGFVFGVGRGVAFWVAAYIAARLIIAPHYWPDLVVDARFFPYAQAAAIWSSRGIPILHILVW